MQVSVQLMAQMTPPGNALKMFYNATDLGFTYVTVPNASGLISGSSFTVEGWVYPMQQSFGKGQNGLEMYNFFFGFRNETNCDFYIMQTAPDKLEARFRNSAGTAFTITATTDVLTNQWQHFALVYNGSSLTLYRNGVDAGSIAATGSIAAPAQGLTIGGLPDATWDYAFPLTGKVDEFRMWNTARSQADLQANMTNVISSSTSGLVLYYKFDQSSGATVTDEKGLNNGNFTIAYEVDGYTNNSTWVESYGMVMPVSGAATSVGSTGFTANWAAPAVGTVTSYKLDVSTSNTFATFVTGYNDLDCGTNLSQAVSGLTLGVTYYYRVRAVKSTDPGTGANSSTITVTTSAAVAAPTITSFTATTGPVGTLVTITGTNLGSQTSFTIGGVNAIQVSNSGTTLVGMVMPGATTGTISVTTAGGTATSTGSFTVTATPFPAAQLGDKLVGTGVSGAAQQGYSVAVSADGSTAIVGGPYDNSSQGAAWIYTRSGNTWSQQGKLVGIGNTGPASQGYSVGISADGNTAIVGGANDNTSVGAVWVFTRSGTSWSQQGDKLVGTGNVGKSLQGTSVAVSADGNTVIAGGWGDNGYKGASWVFTRSGSNWSQQGKLVGTGGVGNGKQGFSVALSADGNTAIVGGFEDDYGNGAAWVFTRLEGNWSQQGSKLYAPTDAGGGEGEGRSVALFSRRQYSHSGGIRLY